MKDLNKLLYGEITGGKINDFKKGLTEIENKHKEYFAKRKPKNEYNKNDRLHNHYGMINDAHKITFGFNKSSDIDPTIITECMNLFNSIFNPNE